MDLDTQIADTLGELDSYARDKHSPETRVRALSAKLRHLEMRRHHEAALRQEGHVRGEMLSAMNSIAENLNAVVESRFAPSDKTVLETRAMGVHLRAVGDKDDPLFIKVTEALNDITAMLADHRLKVSAQQLEWEAEDRKKETDGDPA